MRRFCKRALAVLTAAAMLSAGSSALAGGHPSSAGVPEDIVKHTLTAQFNDLASVEELLNAWRRTGGETELEAYLAGFAQQTPLAPICFLRGSLLVRWGLVTGVTPTQSNLYANVDQWTIWSSVEDKNAGIQQQDKDK